MVDLSLTPHNFDISPAFSQTILVRSKINKYRLPGYISPKKSKNEISLAQKNHLIARKQQYQNLTLITKANSHKSLNSNKTKLLGFPLLKNNKLSNFNKTNLLGFPLLQTSNSIKIGTKRNLSQHIMSNNNKITKKKRQKLNNYVCKNIIYRF